MDQRAFIQTLLLGLVCVVGLALSGPQTCSLSGLEWETAGSTSTAFCCGSFPEFSQTATVSYSLTVNDDAKIYYTSDCDAALDGLCIDCCSDQDCQLVADCNESATCSGTFTVSAADCDLNTLSVVLRCNAGLFDDCEYTWNTLTISLDNAGDSGSCCDCNGLANSTMTTF